MKTHATLKELLLDYENEKDHMYNRPSGLDPDDEMFIHHYVSNNNLALGKPEPLAKNKDSENEFYCWDEYKCKERCSIQCLPCNKQEQSINS